MRTVSTAKPIGAGHSSPAAVADGVRVDLDRLPVWCRRPGCATVTGLSSGVASGASGVGASRAAGSRRAERAPVGLGVVPRRRGSGAGAPRRCRTRAVGDRVDRLGRSPRAAAGPAGSAGRSATAGGSCRSPARTAGRRCARTCGPGGELVDRDRLAEVAMHPVMTSPSVSQAGTGDRPVHVLGLAALAVGRDDHPAGDAVGHPGPLLLAHQVQARVDARRGARAGDHPVLIDVEDLGVDHGRGIQPGQLRGVPPVRGAPPPSSSPAAPSTNAPLQTLSTRAPRSTVARSASISGAGNWPDGRPRAGCR